MINNEINETIIEECSDEDDSEGYYLQTTTDSYDIKEKIRSANNELYDDELANEIPRSQKVTFKEELVDYEPDYSSDDGYVHSPDALTISDNDEFEKDVIQYIPPSSEMLPVVLEELNLSDHEEDVVEDDIVEIIHVDDGLDDDGPETDAEVSSIKCDELSLDENILDAPKKCKKRKKSSKIEPSIEINCRLHCLEQKNLEIIGSPIKIPRQMYKGPRLHLRPRKCCENQKQSKLPVYNGMISEYGLTETQLEKRHKRKERKAKKDVERKLRINEEKMQKDMYNEEIFCAWLKSVANRNKHSEQTNNNQNKKHTHMKNVKPRPNTAHETSNYHKQKYNLKRPYTSLPKNYNAYPLNISNTPGMIMAELIIVPK